MQSPLWKLSMGMSISKKKTSPYCHSVKHRSWPHKQLLSSRYPQLFRTNYTLYVQRHIQTRFDNAVVTEEQLQQQITMFKSLKSPWTNHSLCQMIFVKHKKAKQKMVPAPNLPCMRGKTLSNTEACERTMWQRRQGQ